jgi:hypothetical protein
MRLRIAFTLLISKVKMQASRACREASSNFLKTQKRL